MLGPRAVLYAMQASTQVLVLVLVLTVLPATALVPEPVFALYAVRASTLWAMETVVLLAVLVRTQTEPQASPRPGLARTVL